ncbi:unnamed protein product [Medioppia subpectinata]|uniref:Mitochondrial carrier protein n=1 Tax=Medioppia subpectinata TaxID=1979941 RepID=A0A7R9PZ78_9ACAR|nr:unnamed protein product [Medioppia subpectinata]CAG2106696.1 unnamed protein product [Medioppia subpectinata]
MGVGRDREAVKCTVIVGGTIGAIITCPLEVVKTRLQSSVACFGGSQTATQYLSPTLTATASTASAKQSIPLWRCIRHIVDTEGPKALFKGLGPNLIGVAPSSFATADTPLVHMVAAASAGFVSCTATNPIWFVKTRLQLDQSETIIHFVIYEFIKSKLAEMQVRRHHQSERTTGLYFVQYMTAGAISKSFASILAYPHEVARTRLREEGQKYRNFTQTLYLVWREEGVKNGLYRGLVTQLIRQIPNTAIMMATYEVIVYCMKSLQTSHSAL